MHTETIKLLNFSDRHAYYAVESEHATLPSFLIAGHLNESVIRIDAYHHANMRRTRL